MVEYLKNGWIHFSQINENLKLYHTNRLKLSLESGGISFGNRFAFHKSLQVQVLELLHIDHPDIACYKLLAHLYVW